MAKYPAFLFYTKDWLQGTAQMMPEEKGVYIDLLCHQHQDGKIPSDLKRLARIAGLPQEQFLPIWEAIKSKFTTDRNGGLVNHKLIHVVNETLTKSKAKKISGIFASLIRLSKLSYNEKEDIKRSFSTDIFIAIPDDKLMDKITMWFKKNSPS